MYFIGAALSTILSLRLQFLDSKVEARQEAHRHGFSLTPYSTAVLRSAPKHSTPSSSAVSSPTSASSPTTQTSVPSSPPHKKTFVFQISPTDSTSENLEDIQKFPIMTQDNMLTPHKSSNLSAPIPYTLKVTADIHPPSTNLSLSFHSYCLYGLVIIIAIMIIIML